MEPNPVPEPELRGLQVEDGPEAEEENGLWGRQKVAL
jgi:hypothetical protein